MVYCSISHCGNSSTICNNTNKGISFHRFPQSPEIIEKWILATGKKNWFPSKYSRICSSHFTKNDFNGTTKRHTLLKTAVPTVDVWRMFTSTDSLQQMSSANAPAEMLSSFPQSVVTPTTSRTLSSPIDSLPSDAELNSDDDLSGDTSLYSTTSARKHKRVKHAKGGGTAGNAPYKHLHEGLKCNACAGDIVGFRYVCIQCPQFNLCSSCEARSEHGFHYVLRVPAPKPNLEIQSVIKKIKQELNEVEDVETLVVKVEPDFEIESETELEPEPESQPEPESKPDDESDRALVPEPGGATDTVRIKEEPEENEYQSNAAKVNSWNLILQEVEIKRENDDDAEYNVDFATATEQRQPEQQALKRPYEAEDMGTNRGEHETRPAQMPHIVIDAGAISVPTTKRGRHAQYESKTQSDESDSSSKKSSPRASVKKK